MNARLNKILKFIYKHALLVLNCWFVIIFALCGMPGRFIPSTNWLELISFDKWVHAGIFFTLCGLAFITQIKYKLPKYFIFLAVVVSIFYGGWIEWMQANVFSQRSADWYDFTANTFGCLVAWSCYTLIRKRVELVHNN